MNYETFVEPKTDTDSGDEIQELTLDEQHCVAGGQSVSFNYEQIKYEY